MLGAYYFQNVASSSIFASQKSFHSEAYHVMDEWRECLGRRNEAGSFIQDTEMDDASTLLTKALNFQARHKKKKKGRLEATDAAGINIKNNPRMCLYGISGCVA